MSLKANRLSIKAIIRFLLDQNPKLKTKVMLGTARSGIGLPNAVYSIKEDRYDDINGFMTEFDNPDPRQLEVTIELRDVLKGGSNTQLDDLCEEVEVIMATTDLLTPYLEDFKLEFTEYEIDEANTEYGLVTLTYTGLGVE